MNYAEISFLRFQIKNRIQVNLSKCICSKYTDFFIRVDYNSENYELIQFNLIKWNRARWKSDN